MTLGETLKEKRLTKTFLTQEEVAKQIGISRVRYIDIENDKVENLSLKTIDALSNYLNKSKSTIYKLFQNGRKKWTSNLKD